MSLNWWTYFPIAHKSYTEFSSSKKISQNYNSLVATPSIEVNSKNPWLPRSLFLELCHIVIHKTKFQLRVESQQCPMSFWQNRCPCAPEKNPNGNPDVVSEYGFGARMVVTTWVLLVPKRVRVCERPCEGCLSPRQISPRGFLEKQQGNIIYGMALNSWEWTQFRRKELTFLMFSRSRICKALQGCARLSKDLSLQPLYHRKTYVRHSVTHKNFIECMQGALQASQQRSGTWKETDLHQILDISKNPCFSLQICKISLDLGGLPRSGTHV
jgi:hypothetical protein